MPVLQRSPRTVNQQLEVYERNRRATVDFNGQGEITRMVLFREIVEFDKLSNSFVPVRETKSLYPDFNSREVLSRDDLLAENPTFVATLEETVEKGVNTKQKARGGTNKQIKNPGQGNVPELPEQALEKAAKATKATEATEATKATKAAKPQMV